MWEIALFGPDRTMREKILSQFISRASDGIVLPSGAVLHYNNILIHRNKKIGKIPVKGYAFKMKVDRRHLLDIIIYDFPEKCLDNEHFGPTSEFMSLCDSFVPVMPCPDILSTDKYDRARANQEVFRMIDILNRRTETSMRFSVHFAFSDIHTDRDRQRIAEMFCGVHNNRRIRISSSVVSDYSWDTVIAPIVSAVWGITSRFGDAEILDYLKTQQRASSFREGIRDWMIENRVYSTGP